MIRVYTLSKIPIYPTINPQGKGKRAQDTAADFFREVCHIFHDDTHSEEIFKNWCTSAVQLKIKFLTKL